MFRQFLAHKEDADWQRILWRATSQEPIQTYRLTTVTYGTACASFLSNACLLLLADEIQMESPAAAEAIRRCRYADDFFAGGDTIEKAAVVGEQLIKALESAGMCLGKWATNSSDLLDKLGLKDQLADGAAVSESDSVSALGLRWLAVEDSFCFRVSKLEFNSKISKRSMLSDIARLFDPIGWLSPAIICAKIMLQDLYMQDSNWDDPVPNSLKVRWLEFRDQLQVLERIRFPRWLSTLENSVWEQHGFSDASERAFAAAIYIVVRFDSGSSSRLVTAKSKAW